MATTIASLCADLREEAAALRALVTDGPLTPDTPVPFMGWTARDSIEHMVLIDRLATLALADPFRAVEERAAFVRGTSSSAQPQARFRAIADYETLRLGVLGWHQLLAAWDRGLDELCAAALATGEDSRVEWFGGLMRAASLVSARHMEVWAYGQDVFDAAKVARPDGARLRNVVEFGLKTFGFSFANRGEAVPPAKPFITLTAPGGETWEWNDPASPERITGIARDFCLVVTQRRHVDDTGLLVKGPMARRWMEIAQCIAGPAMDGPRPVSARI
ncbi:MAG: maleylpyruvate isomerase family mycothiol-dependent enzyme [Novosphingobium sp.]|nr:maleylpyruvate isomerase family mycothiol-dependent enzyme [Novosphingobium sp.]